MAMPASLRNLVDIPNQESKISSLPTISPQHAYRRIQVGAQNTTKMPLISNWPREERTWGKLKSSNMYNHIYYLRYTKFVLYQLTTNNIQIVTGIGVKVLQDYIAIRNSSIPNFPEVNFSPTNLIASLAFMLFAGFSLAPLFTTALFFDIFWPERVESRTMQWIWRIGSAATCIFQVAASLAVTLVVGLGVVGFRGVGRVELDAIRAEWEGTPLVYKDNTLLWVLVAFCWVEVVFVVWSTVTMWRALIHNNNYGPFANDSKHTRRQSVILLE